MLRSIVLKGRHHDPGLKGASLKFTRILGGRLGKVAEWSRCLVPLWCRAWISRCTGRDGERVPHRRRPLARCIICGTTRFRRWAVARSLSRSGRLPCCARCGSLPRHRAIRKIWLHLRRKDLKRARCLQFSRDPSVRRTWFGSFELSIYNGANSIDVQDIARPDASYDIVICNHVLEHVPDHRRALRELGRIVSARGFLFLSVPDPARRARTEDWGRPDRSRHHHFREFGADLAELLKRELPAFSIVEVRAVDDSTGDPDLAYILTRSRTWFRRARSLPLKSRVHAERPFAA
jgi:SAM-dependent methyltransferase